MVVLIIHTSTTSFHTDLNVFSSIQIKMLAAVHQILDMYDTVKMIEEAKRNTERNLLGLDPILPW